MALHQAVERRPIDTESGRGLGTPPLSRLESALDVVSGRLVQSLLQRASRFALVGTVNVGEQEVVGSQDTVSMADFGDALGYFMSQIAFLTYYADPKWTPNLQNTGDGL